MKVALLFALASFVTLCLSASIIEIPIERFQEEMMQTSARSRDLLSTGEVKLRNDKNVLVVLCPLLISM